MRKRVITLIVIGVLALYGFHAYSEHRNVVALRSLGISLENVKVFQYHSGYHSGIKVELTLKIYNPTGVATRIDRICYGVYANGWPVRESLVKGPNYVEYACWNDLTIQDAYIPPYTTKQFSRYFIIDSTDRSIPSDILNAIRTGNVIWEVRGAIIYYKSDLSGTEVTIPFEATFS